MRCNGWCITESSDSFIAVIYISVQLVLYASGGIVGRNTGYDYGLVRGIITECNARNENRVNVCFYSKKSSQYYGEGYKNKLNFGKTFFIHIGKSPFSVYSIIITENGTSRKLKIIGDDSMERKLVLKKDIIAAFSELGVERGQSIEVHTSLSSLGFVCGGSQVVIEALIESVGEEGTIMMPTQTWKNLDPAAGVHWEEPEEWWQIIRDNWPAYDKNITPTNTMGVVAEMFRKWNGTLRSNHPARSVAAWGKYAKYLTENHDISNIFGEGSPFGKLYELEQGMIKIRPFIWQMSEQIIRESIIAQNIVLLWKTKSVFGKHMKLCLLMVRTLNKSAKHLRRLIR